MPTCCLNDSCSTRTPTPATAASSAALNWCAGSACIASSARLTVRGRRAAGSLEYGCSTVSASPDTTRSRQRRAICGWRSNPSAPRISASSSRTSARPAAPRPAAGGERRAQRQRRRHLPVQGGVHLPFQHRAFHLDAEHLAVRRPGQLDLADRLQHHRAGRVGGHHVAQLPGLQGAGQRRQHVVRRLQVRSGHVHVGAVPDLAHRERAEPHPIGDEVEVAAVAHRGDPDTVVEQLPAERAGLVEVGGTQGGADRYVTVRFGTSRSGHQPTVVPR